MWLAVLLFVVILALFAFLDTRKPKKYPPGPKWLPVIGSALTVLEERKRTGYLYKATAGMAAKYGPVVGLKVGKDLLVIVYGRQAMREFLASDDLAGRPSGDFFKIRTWGQRLGVLLTDSEPWQEQRRFFVRQLREFGFGRKNMSSMIEEETHSMVHSLAAKVGASDRTHNGAQAAVVQMENAFNIHILNTLWTMLAGTKYSPEDKTLCQLQSILAQLFAQVDMVGAPFSQFPILKFVAPELSGYKLYMETHVQIWDFIREELQRHKETFDENNPRDFMDVYLQMIGAKDRKETFCEDQLLAICMDMFMAGSETTSNSLGFGFLNLILHPEVQRKAQEEIDRVVGRNRLPSLDDRPNMPYVECVVLEGIRMFAGRAFTVPHRALKETTLCNYVIPKDAMIIANLHGTMMGPECGFEDPESYKPERFMTSDNKIHVSDAYIPFGLGKHRCMGESLARANVFLFTATLLQHFHFSIVPECPPTVESVDGVTPGPLPYKALVTLRD